MNDIELTAYCGLYCGDCIHYRSRAGDLARDLMNELQDSQYGKYAEVKKASVPQFEHFDKFEGVLEGIVGLQCNTPCRVGDGCPAFSCEILKCCREKEFDGCWECEEFETCGKLDFLEKYHGNAPVEHLRKIKELGLDNWAGHRRKFFKWQ